MANPRDAAIVTGASRGIGAATARLLASRGLAVLVNYASDADAAGGVVAGIR
ncbi:MAG: SDR family NAD(P)-dependent oxidoreductase, partial [Deltaproteobacteria bacterium]